MWEDKPLEHLQGQGTYVSVCFRADAEVPYATTIDLIQMLRRHYLPLLEHSFLSLYATKKLYPKDLRFFANGEEVPPFEATVEFQLDNVRKFIPRHGKKPLGYSVFGTSVREYPIDPSLAGILLCTHGKVIKADNFGQFPSGDVGTRIFGLAELPTLINFVTTSKTDFRPRPGKNRDFQRLYETVRNEYKEWLSSVGVETVEEKNITEARQLERELRKLARGHSRIRRVLRISCAAISLERKGRWDYRGQTSMKVKREPSPMGKGLKVRVREWSTLVTNLVKLL